MAASLFVVTNRASAKNRSADDYRLRDVPNSKGLKELRLFQATPQDKDLQDWRLELIKDRPRQQDFAAYSVQTARRRNSYRGSDLAAARLVDRLRRENKNLVVFIHGYNNNAEDAFRRAWRLAERYQADTNHADHARWVERLRTIRRVYIAINQDDAALRLSAMTIGDQQQPRLGNTLAEHRPPAPVTSTSRPTSATGIPTSRNTTWSGMPRHH